ncbi:MAG: penicillin-binding protein 2 [Bdellovibrionales bacterium]|nr:penicillin-binding protein 2 [Bdellovibrionales bacterium]
MSIHFPSSDESDSGFYLHSNFRWARIFILLFMLILVSRLWFLQILNGEDFRVFSEKNLLKESDVFAPRGKIFDRDGKVLAENLPAYKATITPQYTENLETLATDLGKALDMDPDEIVEKVKKSLRQSGRFFPVDIKLHLTRDELFKVELLKLDHFGLDAQEFILRNYPHKGVLGHLLGYVREISQREIPILSKKRNIKFKQKDIIGKKGIEESFDTNLRGKKGKAFVIVDAKGRQAAKGSINAIGESLKRIVAEPGTDVFTTIDLDLQTKAFESFEKHKRVGSLVAMTPKGEILAWVSYPPFDPNIFAKRVSPEIWRKWVNNSDRPLRNKVIQDHYSPGSTFKPIVALAGLQLGYISANKYVYAASTYKLGKRVWHDHTQTGQGYISVAEAIERSSNVFFYKLGEMLGPDNMARYASALGLGQKTEVPIHGEVPGHIPTSEWKAKRFGEPWQTGESLNMAIGQGHVLVTALQLAQAYSAIAMQGQVYKPQIIKKLEDPINDYFQSFEPTMLRDLTADPESDTYIEPRHFKVVQKGLWRVVNGKQGTARFAKLKPPYSISGKTGTAQVRSWSADQLYKSCENRIKKERHNGWFVAYGSYKDEPKITVAVLTEHSCTSAASVPIVKEVIQYYFEKYHDLEEKKNES